MSLLEFISNKLKNVRSSNFTIQNKKKEFTQSEKKQNDSSAN